MNIIAIIQARMGSTRLPGKVMRTINGKPLIGYLLERVACAKELDGVIVAAPESDADSPLARYVSARGVAFYAGCEESDVASRFLAALDQVKCDAFVRICADSPLIDPAIIDNMVYLFREAPATIDFFTNVNQMTHGNSVEIARTEAYRKASVRFTPEQREHAGFPFFYARHPNLCVDTEEDFQRVSRVIEQMTGDHTQYGVDECLKLCRLQ